MQTREPRREQRPRRRDAVARALGRNLAVAFVARLLACWAAGWAVLALVPGIERWVIRATLASLFTAFRMLTGQASTEGATLTVLGSTIEIVKECTSLVPTALLVGAIAAFPAPAKWKIVGLAAGTLALWIYNLVRVSVLIVVLARMPRFFDLAHVVLWQTMTLIVVAGLFVLWLNRIPKRAIP